MKLQPIREVSKQIKQLPVLIKQKKSLDDILDLVIHNGFSETTKGRVAYDKLMNKIGLLRDKIDILYKLKKVVKMESKLLIKLNEIEKGAK